MSVSGPGVVSGALQRGGLHSADADEPMMLKAGESPRRPSDYFRRFFVAFGIPSR